MTGPNAADLERDPRAEQAEAKLAEIATIADTPTFRNHPNLVTALKRILAIATSGKGE